MAGFNAKKMMRKPHGEALAAHRREVLSDANAQDGAGQQQVITNTINIGYSLSTILFYPNAHSWTV